VVWRLLGKMKKHHGGIGILQLLSYVLLGGLLVLAPYGLTLGEAGRRAVTAWLVPNTLALLLATVVAIAIHELGHWLFARGVGLSVPLVVLGKGKLLYSRRFGATSVSVHLVLLWGGFTVMATRYPRGRRLRTWIATLGGPLVTVVTGGLAFLAVDHASSRAFFHAVGTGPAPLHMFALGSAVVAILALVPSMGQVNGSWMMTDGLRLLASPFLTDCYVDALALMAHHFAASERLVAGDLVGAEVEIRQGLALRPEHWVLRYWLVDVLRRTGRDAEGIAIQRALLDAPAPLPDLRAHVLNWAAWDDYASDDPARRAEADAASAEALELAPADPNIADTRGHVLVWLGRAAEARPLFERAYRDMKIAAGRAAAACGLAKVHALAGAPEEARAWLERAREHHPASTELARAEAVLAAVAAAPAAA
jgi:hypothetical protein